MSIADPASLEVPPAPRRRHAAVAGMVGGPYPNLATPRRRPRLAATAETSDPVPALDHTLVELHAIAPALPAGGPYPNLSTRP
jgi:hypothetical protein